MKPRDSIIAGRVLRPGWAQWPALLWVAARGQTSSVWGASLLLPGLLLSWVIGWTLGSEMVTNGLALAWVTPVPAKLRWRTLTLIPLGLGAELATCFFFPRVFYGLAGVGLGGILLYVVLGLRTGMVSWRAGERAKAQELIAGGHVVVTVNGLVSWPHAGGHATRLFRELEQEWSSSGLCAVVSTTKPELARRYERYGFILVRGSSPAVLFRCF